MSDGTPPSEAARMSYLTYAPPSFNNIFQGNNPFDLKDKDIQGHTQAVGENGGGGDLYTPGKYKTAAVGENGTGGSGQDHSITPGDDGRKFKTQAIPENGGGGDAPLGSVGPAPTPWDDTGSGVATTMAIPENGGGRTPQEQTGSPLGPKLQGRVDKHRERLHRRDLKMHDRLQKMESKGRSQDHIEGRIRRFNDRTNDIRSNFDLDMANRVGSQSPRSGQEQAAKDKFLEHYKTNQMNAQMFQASYQAAAKLERTQNAQNSQMKHAPPKASIKDHKPKADGTGGLHTDKKWSQLSKSERKEVKAIHGDKAKNSFQDQRAKSMGYENEQAKKDDFALKRKVVAGEASHAEKREAGMGSNQQRRAAKRAEREKKRAQKAKAQKFKDDKVKKITGKS